MRHVLRTLPERVALGLGAGARAGSRLETTRKAYGDMGLSPDAVASLLEARRADALVCGHVHWGKRYALEIDGSPRDVIVLSAWEDTGTYVRIDDGRIDFVEYA
jgi:UDP-2,3-diacylglucosamine pyrophosphatase LpxH